MTSQKSLKNNVNTKDFLRSLKGSIVFPAVAAVVLLAAFAIPVLTFFLSKDFQAELYHNEISVFLTEKMLYIVPIELMPVGMVLCGMMTAIKSFMFQMKKNQTNVFFCIGMKRTTLFLNRTIAGFLMLFIAVLIPMTLTYIFNIAFLGASAHLTQIYLYLVFLLTVSGFTGFALGAFATTISGNIFEAALTAGTSSLLPYITLCAFDQIKYLFLRGYSMAYGTTPKKILNPFAFGFDLNAQVQNSFNDGDINTYYYPLRSLCQTLSRDGAPDKYKVPEAIVIDMGWLIPIIFWLVISVALVGLGLFLFNKRRAEHANSFGHFKLSTAINATMATVLGGYFVLELIPGPYRLRGEIDGGIKENVPFWIAVLFVATFVVYFLSQLILTRKIKRTLKSLALYGVLACVITVGLVAASTDYFGTYNKLPEISEIKSVQFEATVGPFYNTVMPVSDDSSNCIIESDDEDDIKAAVKLFDMICNDKKTKEGPITTLPFLINTKDGKVIERIFTVYSEETYLEYKRLATDTEYFDKLLEKCLITEPEAQDEDEIPEYAYYDKMGSYAMMQSLWSYFDSSLLSSTTSISEDFYSENVQTAADIDDSKALCKALYDDLVNMSYDSIARNPLHPLGAVSTERIPVLSADYLVKDGANIVVDKRYGYYYESSESKSSLMQDVVMAGANTIYIYPEMTNTIKFLEEKGFKDLKTYDGKIKEVLYTDSTTPFNVPTVKLLSDHYKSDAFGYQFEQNPMMFYMSRFNYGITDGARGVMEDNPEATTVDFLKKAYNAYEHPLTNVTDAEKVNAILNKCVPDFATTGDKGRYVYVVYENGPLLCYYLPEQNLGVLK